MFCDPQIALVGETWDALAGRQDSVAIGEALFDRSGRARLARATGGALRVYADKATARLLGAAILAPAAEHMAHLLAYAIDRDDGIEDLLKLPVYHPTHEEVLRQALRMALRRCDVDTAKLETIRCKDAPVDCPENTTA